MSRLCTDLSDLHLPRLSAVTTKPFLAVLQRLTPASHHLTQPDQDGIGWWTAEVIGRLTQVGLVAVTQSWAIPVRWPSSYWVRPSGSSCWFSCRSRDGCDGGLDYGGVEAGGGRGRCGGAHRQDERRCGESTDDDDPPNLVEAIDDGAGGSEERDGERDTKGAAELADGLGGGAADAGAAGWQCLRDHAGELGEDERDSKPAEQHRREEVAQVVIVRAEHRQPEQAASGVQDATGDEERSLPDPAGELAGRGATTPTTTGPGATPKPACSTDHPDTSVRKRIEPKNSAANAVPNTSMAMFAHLKFGMRNRSRSSAGARVCCWWATNTASTTSPATSTPMVRALSHP